MRSTIRLTSMTSPAMSRAARTRVAITVARVVAARGFSDLFDAVYGVEHADFRPKPERSAFETVFGRDGTDTRTAAMFEDDPRNLAAPHELGMRTVLVGQGRDGPDALAGGPGDRGHCRRAAPVCPAGVGG